LPFKQLLRKAFQIATGDEEVEKFTSSWHKRQWFATVSGLRVRLGLIDNLTFFTGDELDHFAGVAGNTYSPDVPEDVLNGDLLKSGVVRKTNAWVRTLDLPGFVTRMENNWQISGYFKNYTWAKVFKKDEEDKMVFFTIGIDAKEECLVMKLDCQRRNVIPTNALSAEQVKRFDNLVSDLDAKWHEIPADHFLSYDWAKLIEETEEFILHYEA
jgi:hypothetical protein